MEKRNRNYHQIIHGRMVEEIRKSLYVKNVRQSILHARWSVDVLVEFNQRNGVDQPLNSYESFFQHMSIIRTGSYIFGMHSRWEKNLQTYKW